MKKTTKTQEEKKKNEGSRINGLATTAKLRAQETQMHRDEILNDSAFIVGRYGGSLCSQQRINIADSPKAAFVQVTLADPLSRYLRRTCVGRTILSLSIPDNSSATKNQRKRE